MRRVVLLAALLLASPACAQPSSAPPAQQDPISSEVRAVIERSRNPTTDYSNFQTIRVLDGDQRFTAASNEFHRGRQHRIETSRSRMLVDCDTGLALVFDIATGTSQRMENGQGMCGITDSEPVMSSRLLPAETGPWGRVDIIELTGRDFVRRYAVTQDGILASSNYQPRRPDFPHRVETIHTEIRRGSPDPAMFEEASLARAYAPPAETPPSPTS
jgi:hypothetical protein